MNSKWKKIIFLSAVLLGALSPFITAPSMKMSFYCMAVGAGIILFSFLLASSKQMPEDKRKLKYLEHIYTTQVPSLEVAFFKFGAFLAVSAGVSLIIYTLLA